LRYDLTVPFARFVVQHQNEITFPFKRYQIQPVWRADRPQHGRYQEFYQCDADVVGSDSLLYELECVQLFDEVLSRLRVPDFTVKINNRKILSGLTEVCGASDKLIDFVIALDKLDKIGKEGVIKEWQERGITGQSIAIVQPILDFYGSFDKKIQVVKELLAQSEIGQLGISELEFLFKQVSNIGLKSAKIEFDVTLARGLNYYTGAIFEVVVNGVNMGSICGGGRYDDLTGLFGLPGVSGVGISFGADRIYDVLNMLDLYPEELNHGLTLLFTNFGEQEQQYCLGLLKKVRELGLDAELYPTYEAKIKKQLKYADDRRAKFVVLVGESEMSKGVLKLKNMQTGQQEELSESDFFAFCLKQ
jgi:histidyl-tRNA synthetase